MPRPFRTKESYATEVIRRDMVMPFLQQRGFRFSNDSRKKRGTSISQNLIGQDDRGQVVSLWVRLCWRKDDDERDEIKSAAQLLANVDGDQWIDKLSGRLSRAKADGATHLLILQNIGAKIQDLASIPLPAVLPIWKGQRDESRRLIVAGGITRHKNHAENGRSPTIWLRDPDAPSVANILWDHPEVRNLAELAVSIDGKFATTLVPALVDVFDDLENLGRDEAASRDRTVAGFPRDSKVREIVMRLSGYKCERPGCTAVRDYPGALDSHHILGIRQADRPSNCVALCPNCHRDAHFHPDRDRLNAALLLIAQKRSNSRK